MLSVIVLIALLAATPTLYKGFKLYQEVMHDMPLEDKMIEIQSCDFYRKYDEISPYFFKHLVRIEDERFYKHHGFSPKATLRAIEANLQARAKVQGGSTITQQLAKNLYLPFDKVYERKVAELIIAFQIERAFEKEMILEIYSNVVYFGEGIHGIEQAAQHYFGLTAIELSEEQAILLVETLKSPNFLNPNRRSFRDSMLLSLFDLRRIKIINRVELRV